MRSLKSGSRVHRCHLHSAKKAEVMWNECPQHLSVHKLYFIFFLPYCLRERAVSITKCVKCHLIIPVKAAFVAYTDK